MRLGVVCCALAARMALAEDIYIAQTAQGSGTGTNAANARSLAWLNTATNWAAGANKVSAGDTVHLVGTFTNVLTVQASGTSNNPITLLFETGAKFSAPTWPAQQWWGGGVITVQMQDYITIDGGANGVIECTDNGTSLGNQVATCGVGASSAKHLTVKNLTVRNMYVRTGTTDQNGYGCGIQNTATEGDYVITGFKVLNCTLYDMCTGIGCDYEAGCSDYEFASNTIYNVNWGGFCSDRRATSTMTGLSIHHNHIYNWAKWNDTVNDSFHHNGFYGWAESGGNLSNVVVYANTIGPNYGNQYSTSGIFFSGNVGNILIYDNLFLANTNDGPADGMIFIWPHDGYSGFQIYNNTFVANGSGAAMDLYDGTGTFTVKNNLAVGCAFFLYFYADNSTLVADYNLGYNLTPGQAFSKSSNGSSSFKTFAQWQALGYDAHGSSANPNLDANDVPQSGAAAGAGANLSAYFTTDKAGLTRSGAWDIGAYEMVVTNPPPVPPAVSLTAPTNSTSYSAPATIGLAAGVTSNGHAIVKVQFYNGSSLLGEALSAPYGLTWSNVSAGSYGLKATVVYDLTNALDSAVANVVVTNPPLSPPVVSLTAPSSGASYTAPATIVLAASVTSNGHVIAKVQFYNGSSLLGEALAAPYGFTWSSMAAGNYALKARAVYDITNVLDSTVANVVVTNPPPAIPPTNLRVVP